MDPNNPNQTDQSQAPVANPPAAPVSDPGMSWTPPVSVPNPVEPTAPETPVADPSAPVEPTQAPEAPISEDTSGGMGGTTPPAAPAY